MSQIKGWITMLTLSAAIVAGTTGCNTFRGAGKDIQRGGEAIEDAADKTQDGLSSSVLSGPDHVYLAGAGSSVAVGPLSTSAVLTPLDSAFLVNTYSSYPIADVRTEGSALRAVPATLH